MIQITESAQQYLTDVLNDKSNDDYVTLGVKGGGCSGFQYIWDFKKNWPCLLYTSPSPRDLSTSRMPSSA